MGRVYVTDTYLTNIADAIRSKNKSAATYYPSEMAAAINDISTNFDCNIVNNFDNSYQSATAWLEKGITKGSNNIYTLNSVITLYIMPAATGNTTIDTPIITVNDITLVQSASHPLSSINAPIYGYDITNCAGKTITLSGDGSGGEIPPVSFTINNIQKSGQGFNGLAYDGTTEIQSGYQQFKYGAFIFKGNQLIIGNIGVWNGSQTVEPSCCLYIGTTTNIQQVNGSTSGLYSDWYNFLINENIDDLVIDGIHTLKLEQNSFYDNTLTTDENYWKMCVTLHDSSFNNSFVSGYYIMKS